MASQSSCTSCCSSSVHEEEIEEFRELCSTDLVSQLFGVQHEDGPAWISGAELADEIESCYVEDGCCFDSVDDVDATKYSDTVDTPQEYCTFTSTSTSGRRYQPFRIFRRAPFWFQVGRNPSQFYQKRFDAEHIANSSAEPPPRKRHFCLSLALIALAFLLISWRRSDSFLPSSSTPTSRSGTCGRHPTWISRFVALAALATRMLLGADWAGFGTHYCGPLNGADFSLRPVDVLDAMCAQHDYW